MVQAWKWGACGALGLILLMIALLPFPWWWLWRRLRRGKQPRPRFTCAECGRSLADIPQVRNCPGCGAPLDHVPGIGAHVNDHELCSPIDPQADRRGGPGPANSP